MRPSHWLAAFTLIACGEPAAKDPKPHASAATPAATSSASEGLPDPVATIDGQPISLAEMEKEATPGVMKARIDAYTARDNALSGIINEQMMNKEVAARGLADVNALVQAEVNAKIEPPSEEEIKKFFDENQAAMRGATLDQVSERIKAHLSQGDMSARMVAFLGELREKYKVQVFLDPPRVQVAADDSPRFGSPQAPVQIIEFSDFQCPYCTRAAETVGEIKAHYGDKVSVVYRHFPLAMHDRAGAAAEASECAHAQGKFWEYHDKLFANQQMMADADLERYAGEVGIDETLFKACLSSGEMKSRVNRDMEAGKAAGMSGTPGFYVNGRVIGGAMPFEQFKEVIDDELSRIKG